MGARARRACTRRSPPPARPTLLLEEFPGLIEPHAPWHLEREVSHLFRGLVDEGAANALLAERGHAGLRLVDNGTIGRDETALDLPGTPRAYHLIPAATSKAAAVERHMRARGYAPEECIAVGDSVEDLAVADGGRALLPRGERGARRRAAPGERGAHRGRDGRGLLRGRGPGAGGVALTAMRRIRVRTWTSSRSRSSTRSTT